MNMPTRLKADGQNNQAISAKSSGTFTYADNIEIS
jgi:hypothetical protein